MDVRPGWSLDLTVQDPVSREDLDFCKAETRARAEELMTKGNPHTLICSPVCTPFSSMSALTRGKRNPEVAKKELETDIGHIDFNMKLCEI